MVLDIKLELVALDQLHIPILRDFLEGVIHRQWLHFIQMQGMLQHMSLLIHQETCKQKVIMA